MARRIQKVKDIPFEYNLIIDSTKKRTKVVKKMEQVVRSSMEQKDYLSYLREYLNFKECVVFNHISKETNPKIRVEIHHGPFTLYDLCDVVLQKWIDTGMPLNIMLMANEVVELHYRNMVGLVPLTKTVHEAITKHSDKIVIPLYMFHGDYKKFMIEYADYISDSLIEKYEREVEKTKNVTEETFDAWNGDFTYLEYEDGKVEIPEKIEIIDEDTDVTKDIKDTSEETKVQIQKMFVA